MELLGGVDERVRARRGAAARRGGCRPSRRRPCSTPAAFPASDVERASRRRRPRPPGSAPSRRSASRTGSGSGLCRSVSSAPITTSISSRERREAVERETDRRAAASPSRSRAVRPSSRSTGSSASTSANASSVVVERLVVRAVRLDELVDAVGIEVAHLRDQPGPPIAARTSSSSGSRPSTVSDACLIEARMIGPESISVPSRSKRTTDLRIAAIVAVGGPWRLRARPVAARCQAPR